MKSQRERISRPQEAEAKNARDTRRVQTFHDIPSSEEFEAVQVDRARKEADRVVLDAQLEEVLARIDAAESLDISTEPVPAYNTEKDPNRSRGHRAGTKGSTLRRFRSNLGKLFGSSDRDRDQAAE